MVGRGFIARHATSIHEGEAAASIGLALNKSNYAVLIALRAVQSIGGSPIPAIGYGVAADVSPTAERGSMLGPMLSFCNGLSAVAPVVAGVLATSTTGDIFGCFLC